MQAHMKAYMQACKHCVAYCDTWSRSNEVSVNGLIASPDMPTMASYAARLSECFSVCTSKHLIKAMQLYEQDA